MKKLTLAAAVSSLVSISAQAVEFTNNANDVRYETAQYDMKVVEHGVKVNIPGAEVSDIIPGVESTGTVAGFLSEGTLQNAAYGVQLTVDRGKMGVTAELLDGSEAKGLGLYAGNGTNRKGGVLKSMKLKDGQGGDITVTVAGDGCTQGQDGAINFDSDDKVCHVKFAAGVLSQVDSGAGGSDGQIEYTVASDRNASPETYTNKINYTVALLAIPS